ncbi:LuxR C-terminal-related transcriptional regulator [Streptomyces sp. NPDC056387]|uniref:helix-turn-helix transcriptional regulator n=1 Tax=Streptomyces sp. NPDC056387 TaxID=3345803 RepID=UPI0035E167F5
MAAGSNPALGRRSSVASGSVPLRVRRHPAPHLTASPRDDAGSSGESRKRRSGTGGGDAPGRRSRQPSAQGLNDGPGYGAAPGSDTRWHCAPTRGGARSPRYSPPKPSARRTSPFRAREADILSLSTDGAPSEEAAQSPALAPGTVRNHLSSATTELGAENRHAAAHLPRPCGRIN